MNIKNNRKHKCPVCKEPISLDLLECPICQISVYDFLPTHNGICMICDGAIDSNALKCKHCGEWQVPYLRTNCYHREPERLRKVNLSIYNVENSGPEIVASLSAPESEDQTMEMYLPQKMGDNSYEFKTISISYEIDYSTVDILTRTVWLFRIVKDASTGTVLRRLPDKLVRLTQEEIENMI